LESRSTIRNPSGPRAISAWRRETGSKREDSLLLPVDDPDGARGGRDDGVLRGGGAGHLRGHGRARVGRTPRRRRNRRRRPGLVGRQDPRGVVGGRIGGGLELRLRAERPAELLAHPLDLVGPRLAVGQVPLARGQARGEFRLRVLAEGVAELQLLLGEPGLLEASLGVGLERAELGVLLSGALPQRTGLRLERLEARRVIAPDALEDRRRDRSAARLHLPEPLPETVLLLADARELADRGGVDLFQVVRHACGPETSRVSSPRRS
jgi:hypothetical protein